MMSANEDNVDNDTGDSGDRQENQVDRDGTSTKVDAEQLSDNEDKQENSHDDKTKDNEDKTPTESQEDISKDNAGDNEISQNNDESEIKEGQDSSNEKSSNVTAIRSNSIVSLKRTESLKSERKDSATQIDLDPLDEKKDSTSSAKSRSQLTARPVLINSSTVGAVSPSGFSGRMCKSRRSQSMLKLSTVAMSSRAKSSTEIYQHYVIENKKPKKVVRWDEATNARPPLRIDCEGPTMCTYSPLNRPTREKNSPIWSFGRRTHVEHPGGNRTSWEKTWFQDTDVWRQKADFHSDKKWPSPTNYTLKQVLGPIHITSHTMPSHTIADRRSDSKIETRPSPDTYDHLSTFKLINSRSISHAIGKRARTIMWPTLKDRTPGPGAYNPKTCSPGGLTSGFTINANRPQKQYGHGPFTLF